MLYKYHVALIKEQVIINDQYYKREEKPDNTEYKRLLDQYHPDQIILNTIEDDELNSITKEEIDITKL